MGLPLKVNVGSIADAIQVLSSPQNRQRAENSTQGDEPLSHVLDDISVLAGNGTGDT